MFNLKSLLFIDDLKDIKKFCFLKSAYLNYEQNNELNEMIEIFKSITTATEIMSELPLTEEQITASNIMLEKIQEDWSDNFIQLLEYGTKWLNNQKEDSKNE